MAQVKLGLDVMPLVDQIKLGKEVATALTNNPNFPTPDPPAGDLLAFAAAAETAMLAKKAADDAAQTATINQRAAQIALTGALTSEGSYVQNKSGGDEVKIKSAGLSVRHDAAPIGLLPAPENLHASLGDMPGEIDLQWNRLKGATAFVPQFTTDPMTSASVWTTCPPSTKSKCTVPNLVAGTRYWFRVAAVGAAGQGPWSDPATKMAQ